MIAAALLAGQGPSYQVLRGLGMAGQVLIDTSGSSTRDVEAWLATNANVEYFEPNGVFAVEQMPNDPGMLELYGLHNTGQYGGTTDADIDAPEAWDISTGSAQIVVAVIDSGVDYTHPELAANIWTNPREIPDNRRDDDGNGFVDDVHGFDFANNDSDPMDDRGHGTDVAGTIAARANNASGVAGVNWTSSIMAVKFLDNTGYGTWSNAARAVNYVTMMRTWYGVEARVSNNSYSGTGYSGALYDAVKANGDAGMLFVAAASNDSENHDIRPHYPANFDLTNVISVAATDRNDRLANFSNFGPRSVDLAAPGVWILSTLPDNQYAFYSGTSMATPHVVGVAALAWSLAPDARPSQIRDAILGGVDPLENLRGVVASGGRLNARNTLVLIRPPVPPPPPDDGPVVRWTGNGGDFNWHNAGNWSTGRVPAPDNQVVIDVPGNITVTISAADATVFSLDSQETIVISGGVAFRTLADSVFQNLTVSGAGMSGSGNVTVNGLFNWTGQGAQQPAESSSAGDADRPPDHSPSSTHDLLRPAERALRVKCPHCGNRIQLVEPEPREVTCENCGSTFQLDVEATTTYPPDRLPKTIGKFQVLEQLGRGAFGTVYKARDPALDRLVAIKVPRAGYFGTPEEEERFVREARSAAPLKHPHIVQVHEIAHEHGVPYIVSDYIEGLTLADLLTGGRPTFRESAELVAQISDSLDYAHRQGVIHRDIKIRSSSLPPPASGERVGVRGLPFRSRS